MNTLENTITTMGLLSKEAYNVGNFQIGAGITANNKTYKVVNFADTANFLEISVPIFLPL